MNLFKDLLKYNKSKIYDAAKTRHDSRLNVGNQYMKERFMTKMLSKHIIRNRILRDFLTFLDDGFFVMIRGVRTLKGYKNYTVKKGDKHIR
jgi:hypothetical protein|tara:strand:+ start:1885 stop:2157 length:273 start_codon:yes stop_codon:yes gene_type:complete